MRNVDFPLPITIKQNPRPQEICSPWLNPGDGKIGPEECMEQTWRLLCAYCNLKTLMHVLLG